MAITAHRLRRLEIWSNWAAATGQRQVVVPDAVAIEAISNIQGTDKLTVSLPTNSPAAAFLQSSSVIRIDQDDTTFDEWKVIEGPDDDDVTGMRSVIAAPIRQTDMVTCDIIRRIDSDGANVPDFESVGLTPAEHISTWVIPAFTRAGLTFIVAGTITPTQRLDMTYSWDSPLAALMRIAEVTGMELDIRRVGSTQYAIDLIPAIGSSAPVSDVRLGRNLVNLKRTRTASEQANRVFPRGSQEDNAYATMARATWRISAIAGSVLTLADPAGGAGPILFNAQLDGYYIRKPNGTYTVISNTLSATQQITVASVTGLAVDDLVQIRSSSTGADLLFLYSPTDYTTYGSKTATLDVPDVPATNNLVKNSAMRNWTGGGTVLTNWTGVGAVVNGTQNSSPPYIRVGPYSIRLQTAGDGGGMISDPVSIFPTASKPYISGFASVFGVAGQFRVELVFTVPAGTVAEPILPDVASNSVNGQFVDLGVSGIDAFAIGATAVQIRIVQHGTVNGDFYVDAAQITESASQQPFVEGSGGTRLWQAANERLRIMGAPQITYDVPLVDLAAVNPGLWASDVSLVVGGSVRVTDGRLAVAITTRIVELRRNYRVPGATSIVLSNKPDDITGTLARPPRPARANIPDGAVKDGPGMPEISYLPDLNGNVGIKATALSNNTRTVRAVANINSSMPTGTQVNNATGQPVIAGSSSFDFGSLLTGLKTGDRFNIAMRAYDAFGVPSEIATLSDVYISGILGSEPGVAMGTPVVSPSAITFPITPNRHTTNFEVYVKEYDTDPGALVDVDGAYATAYDDIVVGPIPARAQVGVVFNLTVPLGAGTNWLMVTIVPYNAYIVGTKGRAKAQGGGTNVMVPTARANVSKTAVQVINKVTMPSTPPAFINMYRDNVYIGQVAVSVGAGADQTLPADTNLTPSTAYTYTYAGYTSGVESSTRTSPLIVTTDAPGGGSGTIPAPTIVVGYNTTDETFNISISPAGGTPSGVLWHVEKATTSGGVYTEIYESPSPNTFIQNYDPMTMLAVTRYFKAWGTRSGYTDSPRSNIDSAIRPKASGG